LVWEKNTVSGWKFTIVYEQANRLFECVPIIGARPSYYVPSLEIFAVDG